MMRIRKIIAGIIFCGLLSGCFFLELGIAGFLSPARQGLYRQIIKNSGSFKFPQFPVIHRISEKFWPEFIPASAEQFKARKNIIIVLGSQPLDAQMPTIDLVYRVITGVRLLRSFPGSLLVLSGGRTVEGISEAEMMGVIAWSRGVDAAEMVLEEKARSTDENARYCAELFAGSSIDRVFLVSRKDHLRRAIPIFNKFKVFQNIKGKDCGVSRSELITQMEAYALTRERLA